MSAEHVLVLYEGTEPDISELGQLIEVIKRDRGIDLSGARMTTYHGAEPTEELAKFLVARLERDGEISPSSSRRMTTLTIKVTDVQRVVAVIWAAEPSAWVRWAIPEHRARAERAQLGVTRRPGWPELVSEPALSFVASARDGAGQQFGDVYIVVSLLPETRPRQIKKCMPGGYLEWVDGVFRDAGARLGQIDIAHWLVCSDSRRERAVHLAYIAHDRSDLLLPWELLSRAEKRSAHKLWA